MKYFGVADDVIALAQYQSQKIQLIDWTNNADTEAFWSKVHQYRDSSDCNPFKELCDLAILTMILPHSNAHIERLFSSMNHIKSKTRSLLTIKFG